MYFVSDMLPCQLYATTSFSRCSGQVCSARISWYSCIVHGRAIGTRFKEHFRTVLPCVEGSDLSIHPRCPYLTVGCRSGKRWRCGSAQQWSHTSPWCCKTGTRPVRQRTLRLAAQCCFRCAPDVNDSSFVWTIFNRFSFLAQNVIVLLFTSALCAMFVLGGFWGSLCMLCHSTFSRRTRIDRQS